jgi:GTP-binding protein
MGSSRGGQRGQDVVVEVPVGTVVREVERFDPLAREEEIWMEQQYRRKNKALHDENEEWEKARREKWILYPGAKPWNVMASEIPDLPRPRRSALAAMMPQASIKLDLDEPMERPMLLVPGAMGGHGNPHFVRKDTPRPKFATKGDAGMSVMLHLELKLLADVGLVGLPNAGKSTLLRALSNSKARVGNWAFTTLQPNIGTVVLDDYKRRPILRAVDRKGEYRTKFTIADIPGLIEDAHLNKGLGLDFLRHVERAAVLAFVIDLNAGDAVKALKALWREVAEYEALRSQQVNLESETRIIEWTPTWDISPMPEANGQDDQPALFKPTKSKKLPRLVLPPMSSKPWFVVATKADLPDTQANFATLQAYLQGIEHGVLEHPSGMKHAWKKRLDAAPVSGIRGEGVDKIPELVLDLLNE